MKSSRLTRREGVCDERDASPPGAGPARRHVLSWGLGVAGTALLAPATSAAAASGNATVQDATVAHTWVATAYKAVQLENLTPPTAARAYAHVAMAMYEAVLPGMPHHRSFAGQVNGLSGRASGLLRHAGRGRLDWQVALSAAARDCLLGVLPLRSAETRPLLVAAHDVVVADCRRTGASARVITESEARGRTVAAALGAWATADGHADASSRPYTPPSGEPWLWESTPPNYRPAIEPFCADIRPLVLRSTDEVEPEPHVPFSTDVGSDFYAQAAATYEQSRRNGEEERAIARFWTDNPGSFTPPFGTATGLPAGHWMLICSTTTRQLGLRLDETLEALARLGVTLHDSFLSCWTEKYRSNLLRPITYVNRYIDPTWPSFVNTPQFPEYTSGHSVSSAAAAVVLTDLLGSFGFLDDSHGTRYPARRFSSFHDAALEAAGSRLFGGIHYPMGIESGLLHGREVGDLVVRRLRTRR